jgi:hypothetical protein
MLVENGGVVESYTLLSSNIKGQMTVSGREELSEFLLGTGLLQEKSKIGRIALQAIEENTLNTMQKDLVWYPEAILSQPFGSGTKVYESYDAVQMIHDMEEYSDYSEPYDAISLLSQ